MLSYDLAKSDDTNRLSAQTPWTKDDSSVISWKIAIQNHYFWISMWLVAYGQMMVCDKACQFGNLSPSCLHCHWNLPHEVMLMHLFGPTDLTFSTFQKVMNRPTDGWMDARSQLYNICWLKSLQSRKRSMHTHFKI